MTKTGYGVLLINVLGAGALMILSFDRLSDHSPGAAFQWVLLYVAAIVSPSWWTYRHYAAFAGMGVPLSREARSLAWSPALTGVLTLLIGLTTWATA